MTYLVVFEDATGAIRRDVLRAALERDWPEAELTGDGSGARSDVRDVEWVYSSEVGTVEGHSHVDGTCIYLDGQLELAAKFAVWYRSLIRDDIDVVFCDESYTFNGVIAPGFTVENVMNIASA